MPTGSPDFNQNPSTNPTSPSYDSGEDTTRLLMGGGSSARSGRWIFATGFEEGAIPFLNAFVSPVGPNSFAGLYNVSTFQGLYCLQLRPNYTSGDSAYLTKTFVYPSSTYGVEFQLAATGSNIETEVMIYSYGYEGSSFVVKYQRILMVSNSGFPTADLYYFTDATNKTFIKKVAIGHFRLFKLVVDTQKNIIKRLFFGSQTFDLNVNGYSVSVAAFLSENVNLQIKTTNKTTFENQYILIDNLIVTADEP